MKKIESVIKAIVVVLFAFLVGLWVLGEVFPPEQTDPRLEEFQRELDRIEEEKSRFQ